MWFLNVDGRIWIGRGGKGMGVGRVGGKGHERFGGEWGGW